MAEPSPTRPLRPDDEVTARVGRPQGCRAGHDQPHNPTWHPVLGLVPALSSVVIGAILVGILLGLELWWFPPAVPWTVALLAVALVVSTVVQLLLGHRGTCLLRRSVRWWLGPIGTLIDPIEMG